MANSTSYEQRILRVIDYIHKNLEQDLSLDALSDVAAMSRFHWHRVFHAMTGETLAQTTRRVRLNHAAMLLMQTKTPIAAVAKKCGYPNVQSFTRVFRSTYSLTPDEFRNTRATSITAQLQESPYMSYKITLQVHQTRRLAALEHIGPYQEIGVAFEKLGGIFATRGELNDIGQPIGVYYDDSAVTPAAELRAHAGFTISATAKLPDGLDEVILPEGQVAVLSYKGPYAGLKDAYRYLYGEWLSNSGYKPRDVPSYSIVVNNPRKVAPEGLRADICLPIQKDIQNG